MPLLLVCFIRRKRNDAWVVLYNGLFLTNPYFTGAQSEGSAPLFHPAFRPFTNLNRFYPVAGVAGNSSTGYGYIQNLHNGMIDT